MKIEIVEFYPLENNKYLGTLHIYIIDYNLDIRGICVSKTKKGYFFLMPGKYVLDEEELTEKEEKEENEEEKKRKWIFYPYVSFIDEKVKKSLIKALQKEGTKFLNEFYKKLKKEEKK